MTKVGNFIIQAYIKEQREQNTKKLQKQRVKSEKHKINIDYLEKTLAKIFSYRKSEEVSQRIRFKIQDLIDEYNK